MKDRLDFNMVKSSHQAEIGELTRAFRNGKKFERLLRSATELVTRLTDTRTILIRSGDCVHHHSMLGESCELYDLSLGKLASIILAGSFCYIEETCGI